MATNAEWRAALQHLYDCALQAESIKKLPEGSREKVACMAAIELLKDQFKEHGEPMSEQVRGVCKTFAFMIGAKSNE